MKLFFNSKNVIVGLFLTLSLTAGRSERPSFGNNRHKMVHPQKQFSAKITDKPEQFYCQRSLKPGMMTTLLLTALLAGHVANAAKPICCSASRGVAQKAAEAFLPCVVCFNDDYSPVAECPPCGIPCCENGLDGQQGDQQLEDYYNLI